MRFVPWLLASLPPLALAAAILILVDPDSLKGFESSLLALDLGVSVFAINFAFVGYQISPYRHLYRGISGPQIAASVCLLLLGTASYGALAIYPSFAPSLSLSVLPFLLFGSIALQALARRETSGTIVLARIMAPAKVSAFIREFAENFRKERDAARTNPTSRPKDMPTHEFLWQLPPKTTVIDPFNMLAALAAVAVKNDDLRTFEVSVLSCLENIGKLSPKSSAVEIDSDARARISDHVNGALRRMWVSVREVDKSGSFAQVLQNCLARYVMAGMSNVEDNLDRCFAGISLMGQIAAEALTGLRRDLILTPVIVSRQIVQRGMDDLASIGESRPTDQQTLFRHHIPNLTSVIKTTGSKAIEVKDADTLYRCFDAFGWLGCSAMRMNNHEVGCACLRALCQLGRECRAAQLECYWSRCALEPWQHANERVDWILSWLEKLAPKHHSGWIRSLEEAFSRLHGVRVSISKRDEGDKTVFAQVRTTDPHVINFASWEGHRAIDYSDFAMLKDLELD